MATLPISRLDMSEPDFEAAFGRLLISPAEADADLAQTVTQIVAAVAQEGDAALVRYTNELDRRTVEDAQALRVGLDAIEQALSDLNPEVSSALTRAAARIRGFHERQRAESWQYEDEEGNLLGQRVPALARRRQVLRARDRAAGPRACAGRAKGAARACCYASAMGAGAAEDVDEAAACAPSHSHIGGGGRDAYGRKRAQRSGRASPLTTVGICTKQGAFEQGHGRRNAHARQRTKQRRNP